MKVLIYPILAVILLAVMTLAVSYFVATTSKHREAKAVRDARWKPYTEVVGDGTIEVGVERVARWGDHERVLKRETVTLIKSTNLGDALDAQGVAEMRASTYNSL